MGITRIIIICLTLAVPVAATSISIQPFYMNIPRSLMAGFFPVSFRHAYNTHWGATLGYEQTFSSSPFLFEGRIGLAVNTYAYPPVDSYDSWGNQNDTVVLRHVNWETPLMLLAGVGFRPRDTLYLKVKFGPFLVPILATTGSMTSMSNATTENFSPKRYFTDLWIGPAAIGSIGYQWGNRLLLSFDCMASLLFDRQIESVRVYFATGAGLGFSWLF